MVKLSSFIRDKTELLSYHYAQSERNLDFEEELALLTPYNSMPGARAKGTKGSIEEFKPYSNLCGLVALSKEGVKLIDSIHEHLLKAASSSPPSYD